MSEHEDDANAPLPHDAPRHIRAFYIKVQDEINGVMDQAEREDIIAIWTWMTMHVPERFLRPRSS